MQSEKDRATATGNKHKKFGEAGQCGFQVMRADRRTDGHTHHNTSQPYWGEAISIKLQLHLAYQKSMETTLYHGIKLVVA